MTIYRHRASGPGTAGDIWSTSMHSSGAGNLATTHAAWSTLVTSFITNTLGALWPNEQSVTELVTDQLDPVTGRNTAQARSAVNLPGTGAGGTLSPRSAIVIGLRTALPTKSGRGRMYWPCVDSTHVSASGNLVSADATAISNGFGTALTAFKVTAAPIVLHRSNLAFEPVTYVSVGVVLGTQKRRTNKVTNAYSTKTI